MPELPEVEIVKRGITPAMLNQNIERLILNRPDLRFPIPPFLPEKLKGRSVMNLQRRGKYILGFIESGDGFVLHLGMSGVVTVLAPGESYVPQKHDHVIFEMGDGGRIVFNDPRRFGFLDFVQESMWQDSKPFSQMGPEPLGNDFNGPALAAKLKGRKVPIKNALLDQSVVAGVGNIYACEALYMAGISPKRMAGSVQGVRAERLAQAIQDVLRKAIEVGGSTLKDYRHADGNLGYFQHHFSVYDKEGYACPTCDCDIVETHGVSRFVQSGRSTFYCSRKQA